MEKKLTVLLVDDDEEDFLLTRSLIKKLHKNPSTSTDTQIELHWVETFEDAVKALKTQRYDAYLVDYRLGSHSGLDLLSLANEMECPAPVILLTGQGSYEVDMAAMEGGAADYLVKGEINSLLLERSIRYAIERHQAQQDLKKAHAELEALHKATSALLQTIDLESLLGQILDAAQSAFPQADKGLLHLITPETGKLEVRAISNNGGTNLIKESPTQPDSRIRPFGPHKGQHWLSKAIVERKTILVPDLQAFPTFPHSGRSMEWDQARSIIVAPLVFVSGDKVFGTLSLASNRPSMFDDAALHLLDSFAVTATAAIHNAMLHQEVLRQAITDPLTLVYNRRGFFEIGEREFERARRYETPLSAIMLDLDHFKQINDAYGHLVGDNMLQALAVRLTDHVRKVDLIGRYGGDEFAVLLLDSDLFSARDIAERLRLSVLKHPLLPASPHMKTSISAGVANLQPEMVNLSSLLARADAALYKAKQNGRNLIVTT